MESQAEGGYPFEAFAFSRPHRHDARRVVRFGSSSGDFSGRNAFTARIPEIRQPKAGVRGSAQVPISLLAAGRYFTAGRYQYAPGGCPDVSAWNKTPAFLPVLTTVAAASGGRLARLSC